MWLSFYQQNVYIMHLMHGTGSHTEWVLWVALFMCMCSRGKCNLITIKKISLFYVLIVHSTNNRKNEYVVLLCISRHFAKALLELAWNGWRGVFLIFFFCIIFKPEFSKSVGSSWWWLGDKQSFQIRKGSTKYNEYVNKWTYKRKKHANNKEWKTHLW